MRRVLSEVVKEEHLERVNLGAGLWFYERGWFVERDELAGLNKHRSRLIPGVCLDILNAKIGMISRYPNSELN